MTKAELIDELRKLKDEGDPAGYQHSQAATLLLRYINDDEISEAFSSIPYNPVRFF